MFKNFISNLSIKIITNGVCTNQNFQAVISKSNNLIRISYDEVYENEKLSTAFSVLSDNSLRISKKGAYSYSFDLITGKECAFSLNYGGYSVDYSIKTISTKLKISDNSINIYAYYKMFSGSESVSNKIYLKADIIKDI